MIRNMAVKDILKLLELGREMWRAGHFKDMDYDDEKVINLFMGILANENRCAFVVEKGEEIIGFFLGYIDTYYFGKDLTSYDLLLYVDQKHRGGRTGIKLLQCYIKWAKSWGLAALVEVTIGSLQSNTWAFENMANYTF